MCLGCIKQDKKERWGKLYFIIKIVCFLFNHFYSDINHIKVDSGFPNQFFRYCKLCGELDFNIEHCRGEKN